MRRSICRREDGRGGKENETRQDEKGKQKESGVLEKAGAARRARDLNKKNGRLKFLFKEVVAGETEPEELEL